MKRDQVIIASTTGILAAVAVGYFGVQKFSRNTMYGVSAVMFGFGAGSYIGQTLDKRKMQQPAVKPTR